MPVKIVINGYFRSGTTMLYKALKESLDENYLSLYEPCYPLLGLVVLNEKHYAKINPLHKIKLWEEYLKLSDDVFCELIRNHPNSGDGILNDRAFKDYIDIFHRLPQKVFLQPNRFHFFLDNFFKDYNASVVHVIRHPLDIYNSISNAYLENSTGVKKIIKMFFHPFSSHNFFGVKREYNWIIKHTGYPLVHYDHWKIKYFYHYSFFNKFVVVWIVSNYFALKSIEKNKGLLFCYELCLKDPQKEFTRLSNHIGTNVEPPEIKSANSLLFNKSQMKAFLKIVSRYKLEEQWAYINNELKKQNVSYL